MKGKLCLSSLIAFCNEVTTLVGDGRVVDVVYSDFKDFDTVSHNIITDKLIKYGLDKQTVRWTEKWLNSQAQRVVINGMKSI